MNSSLLSIPASLSLSSHRVRLLQPGCSKRTTSTCYIPMTPDSLCSTLIRQNARAVGAMGGLYLHDVMQHARAVVGVWAESEETVADRIDNVGGQMLLLRHFSAAKQHSRHGRQFKDKLRLEMLPAVSRATRDREMEQKKNCSNEHSPLGTLYPLHQMYSDRFISGM